MSSVVVLRGVDTPVRSNRHMRLQLRSATGRYAASVAVFHRTTGGDVSVQVDKDTAAELSHWLAEPVPLSPRVDSDFLPPVERRRNPDGTPQYYREVRTSPAQFEIHDLQTTALFTKYNERTEAALAIAVSWNGSGRTQGIQIDAGTCARLHLWVRAEAAS